MVHRHHDLAVRVSESELESGPRALGRYPENIGITRFSCINICWVLRKLFEHKADSSNTSGGNWQVLIQQTCLIDILAYFALFQPSSH